MKKIFLLITTMVMLSMATMSFAAVELTDIAGTKYEEAVNCLVKLEVINGYQDSTFRPENKITRAEMAKILLTAKGEKVDTTKVDSTYFEDVTSEHWALAYINAAYENKLIEGYGDKTFKPDDQVTYAEAITMVIRMLGYRSNVEMSTKAWPDNYLAKAKSLKILKNVSYTEHSEDALRGEVANLVWNSLNVEKRYTTAGILEDVRTDNLSGKAITIDDETFSYDPNHKSNKGVEIEKYENGVIFYTLTKNLEKDDIEFISGLTVATIKDDSYDDYVEDKEEKEGKELLFKNRGLEDFNEEFYDDFEDYVFIGLTYDQDEEEVVDIDLITMGENITADDFEKFDRIYVDDVEEVVYIVSGMPEIEEK
ncbi:MAG: S-layer homology domain-containing protein [Clostridia bacterium]|nr:S-layer homology domain-containing protein [Clostridia bacterium]